MKPTALFLCAALAACNQTTAGTSPAQPAAAVMTDQQAFAAARSGVLANLKDPESAKFGAVSRKTVGESLATHMVFISVDPRTDLVCGAVNSKNGFGGYAGSSVFAYRVNHGDVFIDEGGGRFGSMWCIDSPPA